MLPLIPILLIGKLSIAISATSGGMNKDQLEEYVQNIKKNHPTQFFLDYTASLLVAYHTFLVLLQVADPDREFKDIEDPITHEVFHDVKEVASFNPENLGEIENSNTIIEKINETDTFLDLATILRGDFLDNLNFCLSKVDSLPDIFNTRECLADCLNSPVVVDPNVEQKSEVIREALKISLDIITSAELEQAKAWTKDPGSLGNTRKWMNQKLGLDNDLADRIKDVTDNDTKRTLAQIRAMLFESNNLYRETISRLENLDNGGNDIKQAISQITKNVNDNQKKSWENLQLALFGALSWHMLRQANYVAKQVQYLLKLPVG